MRIDCAKNSELADELVSFLQEKGNSASQKEGMVTTSEKIQLDTLKQFLAQTDRGRHKISYVDTDTYIIAMPMDLEDIGLQSCEFCGYLSHPETLEVHRRSHHAL